MTYDLIILGAGPAGLTAGIYAGRAGLSTLILESGFPGGQAATTFEIANYPGFAHIGGSELTLKMAEQAQACGAKIEHALVDRVDLEYQEKVLFSGEKAYSARGLIIASGAHKRKLDIPGEERLTGAGVSYCATCDGNFFKGRITAVVGGGNAALEDALYLSNLCQKVYLIHRRNRFRGVAALEKQVRSRDNIELILGYTPHIIHGQTAVTGLELRNVADDAQRLLEVDGVFIAVGTIPATALFTESLELDENGYIIAGEDCKTGVPGVFAAGDVRRRPIKQVITACADGATAATLAAEYLNEQGD